MKLCCKAVRLNLEALAMELANNKHYIITSRTHCLHKNLILHLIENTLLCDGLRHQLERNNSNISS